MPTKPTCVCPILRVATQPNYTEELKKRHEIAESQLSNPMAKCCIKQLLDKSCIAINLDILKLLDVVNDFYKNRYELSENKSRGLPELIEEVEKTSTRKTIDNCLFGICGIYVHYAALSPDGWGLSSYGNCTIEFSTKKIAKDCVISLLIENSRNFFKNHPCDQDSIYPPPGYTSGWQERHQLAVVKLNGQFDSSMSEEQLKQLLFEDTMDKDKDVFIEVHLCCREKLTVEFVQSAGLVCKMEDLVDKDLPEKDSLELLKNYDYIVTKIREKLTAKGKTWKNKH